MKKYFIRIVIIFLIISVHYSYAQNIIDIQEDKILFKSLSNEIINTISYRPFDNSYYENVRKKQNYNEIKILPNNKGLFVLNRGIEYEYSEVESIEYYNSNGNLIKKIDRVGSVDNLENIWISPNMNHFFISPCQNIMYGDFGEGFYNDFIRIYSFDNNDSAVHKIENPKYLSKAKYGFISNYFYAIFNYDKFKCKSFLLLFDKNGKCILSKSYIEIISIEEIKKFIGKEKL